jgi:Kef-type K+ transport system membrane component KefB
VTALPVLARILHDRGLNRTTVGSLAVSCAAVTDALAWMALAVVTMLANQDSQQWRMAFIPVFVALLLVFRPLARRLMARAEHSGGSAWEPLAFVLPGLLLSAAWTEWMGLHYIIGAFLFGLLLPKDGLPRVRFEIEDAVHKMGASLLLPVFFVIAGLKVDLSRIGAGELGDFALIMLVAVSSKFGGVFLAARVAGMDRTRAAVLGTLMNTRGLTELVMLSAGLALGLLDQELYSLMVLMAVFTTVLTGPLLRLLYPRHAMAAEVERSAPAESEAAPSRP